MKLRPQQIRRRNSMLAELAEMLVDTLKRNGVPAEKAGHEAEEIAFQLHRRWAGITFVFPMRDELAQKRLQMHIIDRYDGTNADALVREYGVTEDWIYSVLREHHRRKVSENQLTFDLGGPAN